MAAFNRMRARAAAAAVETAAEPAVETTVETTVDEPDYEALAVSFGMSTSKVFRMSLGDLRYKCDGLDIEHTTADTRADLFGKLSCHVKGC